MVKICGHWDNQFVCMINVLINCLTTTSFIVIFRKFLQGIGIWIIPFILCLTMCFPTGKENSTEGFQIAFYLGIAFSILSISLISRENKTSIYAGIIFLTLSISTFAITPMLTLAITLSTCVVIYMQRKIRGVDKIKLLLLSAVFILSVVIFSQSPNIQAKNLSSSTIYNFIFRFLEMVAYPYNTNSIFSALLLSITITLPGMLFIPYIAKNTKIFLECRLIKVNFTIFIFSLILITSLSYARGNLEIPSRYADISNLLIISNAVFIVFYWRNYRTKHRFILFIFSTMWLLIVTVGFCTNNYNGKYFESVRLQWNIPIIANTIEFIDSKGKSFTKDSKLPNKNEKLLHQVLFHKRFSEILPASVRNPIPIFKDEQLSIAVPDLPHQNSDFFFKGDIYCLVERVKIHSQVQS